MSKLTIKLLLSLSLAVSVLLTVPSFADSQARVVRLSDVQGDVQVDRDLGQGYEKAFLNLPITQGTKLQSSKDGRAEVEFEDGSTLRLTPGTVIDFPQLSLRDSGAKISTVHLQEGTAYLKFAGTKDDEFTFTFGREKLSLNHIVRLRLGMADTKATLSVLSGDVQVEGEAGKSVVGKNHSVTFDLAETDRYTVANGVEPGLYDAWDKQQDQYYKQYAGNSSSSYSPYSYGTADLNYYGSFMNAPGYGTIWQPYFAGAGWDPFMNGAWAFSPGYGYGWVSGYPWGWTPYHSGSWLFLPPYGWVWQPGGSWAAWNAPRVIRPPVHFMAPQAPTGSGRGTVLVNRGPVPILMGRSSNQLEITNNSGGLGIPRGGVRNLGQLSRTVQQKGFVEARVHTAPVGVNWWRSGYSAPAGARRGGSAPSISSGRSISSHSSAGHPTTHR